MDSGSVRSSLSVSTRDGRRKSFQNAMEFRITIVEMMGFRSGSTILKNVWERVQPSIQAASSSAMGTFPLMNPWNMNTDMAMENPVCIKISVSRWFRIFKVPP